MVTGEVISGIIIGAIGSIIAVIIVELFLRSRHSIMLVGLSHRLATRIRRERITAFQFTREDYRERLPTFLSRARHSIIIISISFRLTSNEGELLQFFRNRLLEDADFRITISILAPKSSASILTAASLNITHEQLRDEIHTMLNELIALREGLSAPEQSRLQIFVHECLPMGSAILLDCEPTRGTIQVETKLFRAPRIESFGFEVVGPSPFYTRNYRAWRRVLDESRPVSYEDLTP